MSNSLVSGNTVSLKSQPYQEQQNTLAYFKNDYSFPPTAGSTGRFISDSHSENVVEALEVNSQKCWGAPLPLGLTGAHNSQTKPLALSELQYSISSFSSGSCRSFC